MATVNNIIDSEVIESTKLQKEKTVINCIVPLKTDHFTFDSLPDTYKNDIQKTVEILKKEGCKEIYLFGSLVTGKYHDKSDIDIGIRGIPVDKFFYVYGKLGFDTDHVIELTDFDDSKEFFEIVNRHKEIVKIG